MGDRRHGRAGIDYRLARHGQARCPVGMSRCPPLLTLMLLATSGLVLAAGRDEARPRGYASRTAELTAVPAPVSSPRAELRLVERVDPLVLPRAGVRAADMLRPADGSRPLYPAALNRWANRRVPVPTAVRRPRAEAHPVVRASSVVAPPPVIIRPGSFATVERRILFRNQLATMTPGREGTLHQP